MTATLGKAHIPWDSQQPTHRVSGFRICGGNVAITLGYAIFEGGQIAMFALSSVGGSPPTVWRDFWTSIESALSEAEQLCADAEEYAETIGCIRPTEDLDLDDFIHHLTMRIKNGLH